MNFTCTQLGVNEKNQVELGSLRFLKSGTLMDYFEEKHSTRREATVEFSKTTRCTFANVVVSHCIFWAGWPVLLHSSMIIHLHE
jgi:hypothetical protein